MNTEFSNLHGSPRRADRALSRERAYAILDCAADGFLALVTPEGLPYGVPLNFARAGEVLYMHGATAGRKLDCIGGGAPAHFCAVEAREVLPRAFSTRYASAMAFGRVRMCADPDEKRAGLRALVEKYAPQFRAEGEAFIESAFGRVAVLRFDIESVSGKARD